MSVLLDLFWTFFRVSLLAFGGLFGVLPQVERQAVHEHGWVTHEQFVQAYVFSQFLPGPNSAMLPLIGYLVAGWPGFAAAFAGVYLGPVVLMGLAYGVYRRYRDVAWVHRAELAMRPVVLGLIGASAARLWWTESTSLGPHADAARILAVPLTAGVMLAYARGWLGPFTLLFAMGIAWWGLLRLLALL